MHLPFAVLLLLYDRHGTGGWCDVCFHCCMTDMGLVQCLFSLLYDRHGAGGWCDVCFHCCMTDMGLVAGAMSGGAAEFAGSEVSHPQGHHPGHTGAK